MCHTKCASEFWFSGLVVPFWKTIWSCKFFLTWAWFLKITANTIYYSYVYAYLSMQFDQHSTFLPRFINRLHNIHQWFISTDLDWKTEITSIGWSRLQSSEGIRSHARHEGPCRGGLGDVDQPIYCITRIFRENIIYAIFANDLKTRKICLREKLYFKRKFRSWYQYFAAYFPLSRLATMISIPGVIIWVRHQLQVECTTIIIYGRRS